MPDESWICRQSPEALVYDAMLLAESSQRYVIRRIAVKAVLDDAGLDAGTFPQGLEHFNGGV